MVLAFHSPAVLFLYFETHEPHLENSECLQ